MSRDDSSEGAPLIALPPQIGPYRVLKRLGAGGMGEVFLAERTGAGGFRRRCCVKTVLPRHMHRQELLDLFEREAVLAARVSHENVVQVFDYGNDGETLYLAMEFVDGVSARTLARLTARAGQRLTVAEACAIVVDVARGLAAVHGLVADDGAPVGLVHRDVTPDNVMITRDGLAKLGDFGVARAQDSQPTTQTGAVRGKLPYMAPEQVDGHAITQASDVWSLGVSLFQLLTGKRPFDRATELGTMNAIVEDAAPELRTLRPDAPAELAEVVATLLDKDPTKRPPARLVVERLLAAVPGAAARPTALVHRALAMPRAGESAVPKATPASAAGGALGDITAVLTETGHETEGATMSATTPERAPANTLRAVLLGAVLALALGAGGFAAVMLGRADHATVRAVRVDAASSPQPAAPPREAAAPPVAPEPAPSPAPTRAAPETDRVLPLEAPLVHLVAPDTVKWSVAKRALGSGTLDVRLAGKSVVAIDTSTGGRSTVPIVKGTARYDALGTGTLDVRAVPYADVFIGSRAFGTTPLKPKPTLVAGEYRVRLVYEGRERTERITIVSGESAVVRADMNAGGAP